MPENQSDKTVPKLEPLDKRIEQEAARRAGQYAEDFDLLSLLPCKDLDWSGQEEIHIHGRRGREIITTIDQLNFDIRRFLEEHLPTKIAEQLLKRHLSNENLGINVTEL